MHPRTGWRAWAIDVDEKGNVALFSVHQHMHWAPNTPLEAVCLARPPRQELSGGTSVGGHPAPNETCSCGVYATRSYLSLLRQVNVNDSYVVGRVALWGTLVEHEAGFRAQFAYPSEFYATQNNHERVSQLAARYGVSVGDLSSVQAQAQRADEQAKVAALALTRPLRKAELSEALRNMALPVVATMCWLAAFQMGTSWKGLAGFLAISAFGLATTFIIMAMLYIQDYCYEGYAAADLSSARDVARNSLILTGVALATAAVGVWLLI